MSVSAPTKQEGHLAPKDEDCEFDSTHPVGVSVHATGGERSHLRANIARRYGVCVEKRRREASIGSSSQLDCHQKKKKKKERNTHGRRVRA